jgi:hypothetical protein
MAEPRFTIEEEITREYRHFNVVETAYSASLTPIRFEPNVPFLRQCVRSVLARFTKLMIWIWWELQLAMKSMYKTKL